MLEAGLREQPGNAAILYNLACAESQAGRTRRGAHAPAGRDPPQPEVRENARADPDFDPIRREPGFPA